jgi:multidrug resistance efflux pump
MAGNRVRAFAYSALLLLAVPAALYFVPIPGGIETRGFLSREIEQVVRAQVPGFLEQVRVAPGTQVAQGDTIYQISNPQISTRCLELNAKLAVLRQKVISQRQTDRSQSAMIEKGVMQIREEAHAAHRELESLNVRSETNGQLVAGFRRLDEGNFVQRGDRLGIIWGGKPVVRGLMTAEEMLQGQIKVGELVKCQFASMPGTILQGKITQLNPAESDLADFLSLTQLGGGDVVVNPMTLQPIEPYFEFYVALDEELPKDLGYGSSARVLLARQNETIANYVVRKTHVFLTQLAKQ